MPAWYSTYIDANGLRLHLTRTGAGAKPPVVLLHGFSDDGLCWTPLARALEADYDLIMPDARGHGRSDPPVQEFSYLDLADDVAAIIAGLGLREPVVLGHSMGATTALLLAARHPHGLKSAHCLPGGIALEDPSHWWPPDAEPMFSAEWRAGATTWLSDLQTQTPEQLMAAESARQPKWSADELPPWAASKLAFNQRFLEYARPPALDWIDAADWPARAPAVTCPALLLTGDPALGAIIGDTAADSLRAWLPQLQRAHIAGAAHNIRRDQFAAYVTALRPWLAARA